jgi:hypothetical protein
VLEEKEESSLRGFWKGSRSIHHHFRSEEVLMHTNRYGRDETCAMTLSIASSNSFLQTSTSSSHLTLSTSRLGNGAEDITVGAVSESVASDAKRAFYDIGGSPTVADSGIAEGSGGGEFSISLLFGGLTE